MLLRAFLLVLIINSYDAVIYNLNESEYDRMPPLFGLDPFEPCLRGVAGRYCAAELDLVSDTPSELLTMIHEYSENTIKHFNHTKLRYGICVTQRCKNFLQGNTTSDLGAILEACFNESLWRDYKLKVKVNEEKLVCSKLDENIAIDAADITVAVICVTILMLNIIGTFYGFFCFLPEKNSRGNQLLMCFSISRNWGRLVKPSDVDSRQKRLKGIYGIRVIQIMLVISCHSLLPYLVGTDNTQYIENAYYNKVYLILVNGTLIVQTFFIMSGLLLTYNMLLHEEKHIVKWTMFFKGMLMRWLRLTPPYAFVLAITSTWLRYAGTGPLWQTLVTAEVEDCRRDWWLYILYINNYVDYTRCMPHTWYLAADMQLHLVGLAACVLVKGNHRKVVLAALFIVGLIIPAVHTYIQDLDGVQILSPEVTSSFFMNDATFNNVYKRGHTNLASYVLGLALGLLIYHWQNTDYNMQKYQKYRYFYWATVPAMLIVISMGSVFYIDGPRVSVYIRAVYSGLVKPVFGAIVCAVIVGMAFKFENVYRGVLEWRGWAVPSRISFCAYVVHLLLIMTLTGTRTTLVHASGLDVVATLLNAIAISLLCAVPLWLFVEAPLAGLVKLATSPSNTPPETPTGKSCDTPRDTTDTKLEVRL